MVNMLANQRCMIHLSLAYKSICFLAALINIFYIFKLYLEYHVLIKVIPAVPFNLEFPKLSLCFDMTSVISGRPQKEFFTDHLHIFGKTVRELKRKMPQPENLIKHCSYRDWTTDSLIIKQRDDCKEYFNIHIYPLQSYMCYRLTPRDSNYSFFTAANSLEVRRLLYEVTPAPPLDRGHMILPIIHFGEKPFLDRLFADEVLTSPTKLERYIVTYNSYDLKSLPSPYESRCSVQSAAECFTRCIDEGYKNKSRSFHRAIIFNENDSLTIPHFVKDYRAIDSIYSAIKRACAQSCPQVPGCHLSFTATKVSRYPTSQKLVLEVQTLAKPEVILNTVPMMLLLELFTQLTSVCSFWLGFSVIGFCEKMQECPQAKPSIKQLNSLKMRANRLIRFLSLNVRLPPSRQVSPRNRDGRSRFDQLIKSTSLLLKISALISFAFAVNSTLSQYLEYGTLTQIIYRWNPTSASNHAHLCISLEQMIGHHDSPDVTVANYDEIFTKKDRRFDQPLSKLMNKTLEIHKILSGCRLWDKTPGRLRTLTKRPLQECLDYFITFKYFAAGHVCYLVGPRANYKWQDSKIDLVQPGIFHSIILQPTLKSMAVNIVLLEIDDLPLLSRRYAAKIYPFESKRLYRLTTIYREQNLLSAPYQTDCDPSGSKYECLQKCLINKTVDGTGYFPLSEIIVHPVIQRLNETNVIRYTDLKNGILLEKWKHIEKDCFNFCRRPGCSDHFTVTKISTSLRSEVHYELMIGVRDEPDEITTAIPKTTFFWLYYEIFGCANFWLAFIILNANPFERWCRMDDVERKLREKIHQLRLKLSGVVAVLQMRLGLRFERRRTFSWGKLSNWIVKIFCACGSIFHIYLCVAEYTTFPTDVYVRRHMSDKARNFSMMICNRLSDQDWIGTDMRAYYYGKITRDLLDERFDRAFNRSIADLVRARPPSVGQIVACSFRGLPPSFKSTKHEKHLTDRIYFRESANLSVCESIYKRRRLVIGGLICDRYDEARRKKNYNQLLNEPDALIGISTDRNVARRPFAVVIGLPEFYPLIGSLFSIRTKLPPGERWFDVSTTGYRKNILGPPYDHHGLSDVSPYSCYRSCLSSRLSAFNLTSNSPEDFEWHMKLPVKHHLRDPKIASIINMSDESCINRCLLSSPKTLGFYVTKVSRPLAGHRMKKNSVEFLLTVTKNPAIEVTFRARWSLCELIIALGSVLNIWWGLSALGLDSSRENTDSLAVREIDECERLISHMQSILTARSKGRPMVDLREPVHI